MHHSIEICQEIAKKMNSPEKVCEIMRNFSPSHLSSDFKWLSNSLVDGLPGIACFYAFMDQLFPNQKWKKIAHTYLKIVIQEIEKNGYDNYSLFTGLCGICFMVNVCSQGKDYQNLQAKLDNLLAEEIEKKFLYRTQKYIEEDLDIPPYLYNLADGISGIIAYLLLRLNNPRLYKLTTDCISHLLHLLCRKRNVGDIQVPGWYISPNHQLAEEEKIKYPEGSFILATPSGITGCLSVLSLSAIAGIQAVDLYETITNIASWMKSQHYIDKYGINWHHTVPSKEEGRIITTGELDRETWWYGTPAVTRSLYLASKATKNHALGLFAEKTFLSFFSKDPKDWNMMGPSFTDGRAGVLAIAYRMADDTHNSRLWKEVCLLENSLKEFYKPNSPFGFQAVQVDSSNTYRWIDNPGLWRGATGIALSLLLVQRREEPIWDRMFLLN